MWEATLAAAQGCQRAGTHHRHRGGAGVAADQACAVTFRGAWAATTLRAARCCGAGTLRLPSALARRPHHHLHERRAQHGVRHGQEHRGDASGSRTSCSRAASARRSRPGCSWRSAISRATSISSTATTAAFAVRAVHRRQRRSRRVPMRLGQNMLVQTRGGGALRGASGQETVRRRCWATGDAVPPASLTTARTPDRPPSLAARPSPRDETHHRTGRPA